MHRYNNQDHSMLTAMTAVDQILAGKVDKAAIWEINTEEEYHEEKAEQMEFGEPSALGERKIGDAIEVHRRYWKGL